jgi:NAD(P)H-dependent FMN reductase
MKIVVISGSPRKIANTSIVMEYVYNYTKTKNHDVKFVNLSEGKIDYYRGWDVEYSESTKQAAKDITEADVWLIGSPIYNSFFSAALKNLFEFVNYKETEGKTAGLTIVASGNIGFIDVQTLLTQLMSYFGVVTNPKVVYITADTIKDGQLDGDSQERLKKMVDHTLELSSRQC